MKSKFTKGRWDTRDELLARIFDAAARIEECEDQLRRATRDFHTRVAKCLEVYNGNFGAFIVKCNKFVISL